MAKSVCFYFQVHQPSRLAKFNYFGEANSEDYFNGSHPFDNGQYIEQIGKKSYHPANRLLLKLLNTIPEFHCSFSISGIALEQFEAYDPELIESFKKLAATKKVEFLSETYYHSLSFIYSRAEFAKQIMQHRRKIFTLFRQRPQIFRNTELIYNNELGSFIKEMGFTAILAEGWDYYLGDRSPNLIYTAPDYELSKGDLNIIKQFRLKDDSQPEIKLLLKNYKLSDDIAFRFSNSNWEDHPLTVDKFVSWIVKAPGDTVNLFMDYETFGEHQWEETGIFEFMEKLPAALVEAGVKLYTPGQTLTKYNAQDKLDVHHLTSWADNERDLSAWLGNKMQRHAADLLYKAEELVVDVVESTKSKQLQERVLDIWRKLQTSDHFYYMSTKYWNDGDIHKYFSPYESPYDAYINYMNVLEDFTAKLKNLVKYRQVAAGKVSN